jgi:hypothetical protein
VKARWAIAFAVGLLEPAAARATQGCVDPSDAPERAPKELHVLASAPILCGTSEVLDELMPLDEIELEVRCEPSGCQAVRPAEPPGKLWYKVHDAVTGDYQLVPSAELTTWHFGPGRAQRFRVEQTIALVRRGERTVSGSACHTLPPGRTLHAERTYAWRGVHHQSSGLVLPTLASPAGPPRPPAFDVKPGPFDSDACRDHAYFRFVPRNPSPDLWYRWVIKSQAGDVVQAARLGREAWLYAENDDEVFDFGEQYFVELQAMNEAGEVSPALRERFVLEQTGASMYNRLRAILIGGSLLALAFVGGGAFLLFKALRARWRERPALPRGP